MIAVYPGSFDPITSGHLDIIERTASLYDDVIVVVATNSAKNPVFTVEERIRMIQSVLDERKLKHVTVDALTDRLLVEYATAKRARVIVKGLRAVSDFEYEFQMALLNRRLNDGVETVFMMTGAEHSYLSSSIVREIARLGGEIAGLVPDAIISDIRKRFSSEVTAS